MRKTIPATEAPPRQARTSPQPSRATPAAMTAQPTGPSGRSTPRKLPCSPPTRSSRKLSSPTKRNSKPPRTSFRRDRLMYSEASSG